MKIKSFMKKYTWLIVLTAILISFIFPAPGLLFKPYLSYMLMLLMFLSCIKIDFKKVIQDLKHVKQEISALAVIHLCSPVIVLLLKPIFPQEIFLGLIIASVMSSGMSVVFLSDLYGGAPAQALVITSLSTILSPLTVPALILLFTGSGIKINYLDMAVTMLKLVILPIVIAAIVRKIKWDIYLKKNRTYISIILLFFLILGLISPVRNTILSNLKLSAYLTLFVIFLIIINFILGFLIGKSKKEKITFAITTSYKNFTLSTVIALSIFNPIVALPSIVYTVVNNLLLIPLQLFFTRKKS